MEGPSIFRCLQGYSSGERLAQDCVLRHFLSFSWLDSPRFNRVTFRTPFRLTIGASLKGDPGIEILSWRTILGKIRVHQMGRTPFRAFYFSLPANYQPPTPNDDAFAWVRNAECGMSNIADVSFVFSNIFFNRWCRSCFARKSAQAWSEISPTRLPCGVSLRSALSIRKCSRNSAREVNIRYGSFVPLEMRSSIKIAV